MSLDISVTSKHTGESMDMNWLRNPFGLCPWAEANYIYVTKSIPFPDNVFHDRQIGIPMDYFSNPCFHLSDKYRPDAHTLTHYQDWYRDLIKFAEMLQDPDAVYYCSN